MMKAEKLDDPLKDFKDIDIITTVDLKTRPINILYRAIIFFKICYRNKISIIVGHANRNTIYDKFLYIIPKIYKNVSIISEHWVRNTNNSRFRNNAINQSTNKFILFLDIDIYPDIKLIQKLRSNTIIKRYSMAPCLYLTKEGTKEFKKDYNINRIINLWLKFNKLYFLHIAIPSSCICIRRIDIYKIGLFDEKYEGYGYEDFDFMIRMALYYKAINLSSNSSVDETYISPLFSTGFREDLGVLCLENLIHKNILLHLYHKKYIHNEYYLLRENNKKIFHEKFFSSHNYGNHHDNQVILFKFLNLCRKYNINYRKFSILFLNFRI